MSSKKGISVAVGRAKKCFVFRRGGGGLCADYQRVGYDISHYLSI